MLFHRSATAVAHMALTVKYIAGTYSRTAESALRRILESWCGLKDVEPCVQANWGRR